MSLATAIKRKQSLYDSGGEESLVEFLDARLPADEYQVIPQMQRRSIAPRPWEQLSTAQKFEELQSFDVLICQKNRRNPVCLIQYDGVTHCKSYAGGAVYAFAPQGLGPKIAQRQMKFQKQVDDLGSVGVPVMVIPGYINPKSHVAMAVEITAWLDKEARRIDPENQHWDRLISLLNPSIFLTDRGPNWAQLEESQQFQLKV